MAVRFDCVKCGSCCHDLRLTLSVAEAVDWARQGLRVQILCEAIPWPDNPECDDQERSHACATSFPARSSDVQFRINATLVAVHDGACPHLRPDHACGNYAARPRICRIYPLESRPFVAFDPARKRCPSEAWAAHLPVIARAGEAANRDTAAIIADHRACQISDVPAKAVACQRLAIDRTGFANEGVAVYEPSPAALIAALTPGAQDAGLRNWTILTNRISTLALLGAAGCAHALVNDGAEYIGAFEDRSGVPTGGAGANAPQQVTVIGAQVGAGAWDSLGTAANYSDAK